MDSKCTCKPSYYACLLRSNLHSSIKLNFHDLLQNDFFNMSPERHYAWIFPGGVSTVQRRSAQLRLPVRLGFKMFRKTYPWLARFSPCGEPSIKSLNIAYHMHHMKPKRSLPAAFAKGLTLLALICRHYPPKRVSDFQHHKSQHSPPTNADSHMDKLRSFHQWSLFDPLPQGFSRNT